MTAHDAHTPIVTHAPAGIAHGLARLTAPIARPISGRRFFPLYAVVRHRGRTSGREYAIPVAIRASDATFTIALPWGDGTQWVQNLLAAGGGTIRWKGRDHAVSEPTLHDLDDVPTDFSRVQLRLLRATGVRRCLRLRRV